jgi:hypothetical protein
MDEKNPFSLCVCGPILFCMLRIAMYCGLNNSYQVCKHLGVTTPTPSSSVPGRPAAWILKLPVPQCCLLDQSGFLVSLVTGSTSAVWALPASPGAAVAEETLQPSWALAGEGGWCWDAPSPVSSLLGPRPSRTTLGVEVLGNF